jgi:hypothetical protein
MHVEDGRRILDAQIWLEARRATEAGGEAGPCSSPSQRRSASEAIYKAHEPIGPLTRRRAQPPRWAPHQLSWHGRMLPILSLSCPSRPAIIDVDG